MRMKRRELFPLAAGIVAGTALAPRLAGAADKKSLVLVTNASADFWTIARRGIEKAQKELPNYTCEIQVISEATAAEQRRVLNDLLTRGVAGGPVNAGGPQKRSDNPEKEGEQAGRCT